MDTTAITSVCPSGEQAKMELPVHPNINQYHWHGDLVVCVLEPFEYTPETGFPGVGNWYDNSNNERGSGSGNCRVIIATRQSISM